MPTPLVAVGFTAPCMPTSVGMGHAGRMLADMVATAVGGRFKVAHAARPGFYNSSVLAGGLDVLAKYCWQLLLNGKSAAVLQPEVLSLAVLQQGGCRLLCAAVLPEPYWLKRMLQVAMLPRIAIGWFATGNSIWMLRINVFLHFETSFYVKSTTILQFILSGRFAARRRIS